MTRRRATIRTIPQPSDINKNGNIFGGWVLSQMDIAGGVESASYAKGAVATVAIEGMKFLNPILIGDIISIYTEVEAVGRTSMTIGIEVYATRADQPEVKVTEGRYIFVAIDENGKPRPVAPLPSATA